MRDVSRVRMSNLEPLWSQWNWLQKWLRLFRLFTIKSTFLSDIFHPIELSILVWISFFSAVANKSADVAGVERFLESLSAESIKRSSVNRDESVLSGRVSWFPIQKNFQMHLKDSIELEWIDVWHLQKYFCIFQLN